MNALRAVSIGLAVSLALAGCGKDKAPDKAAAGGEILPRSVTDDMLPYDTVRSQPSLAAPETDVTTSTSRPRAQATGSAEENADVVVDADPAAKPSPATPAAEPDEQ